MHLPETRVMAEEVRETRITSQPTLARGDEQPNDNEDESVVKPAIETDAEAV
jgi:hypothetical protein